MVMNNKTEKEKITVVVVGRTPLLVGFEIEKALSDIGIEVDRWDHRGCLPPYAMVGYSGKRDKLKQKADRYAVTIRVIGDLPGGTGYDGPPLR